MKKSANLIFFIIIAMRTVYAQDMQQQQSISSFKKTDQERAADTKKENGKPFFTKKVLLWMGAGITALATILTGGYLASRYKAKDLSHLESLPLELQIQILENSIKEETNLVSLRNDMTAFSASRTLRYAVQSRHVQELLKTKRNELLSHVRDTVSRWNVDIGQSIKTPEDLSPALLVAARRNAEPVIIRTLVMNGANINVRNHHGQTPAMLAAKNGYTSTLQSLIDLGADLTLRDNTYQTIQNYAFGDTRNHFSWTREKQKRLEKAVKLQYEAKEKQIR